MTSTVNLLSPAWLAIRAQLRDVLEFRARQRALERAMADYASASDRTEMDAILDRHDDADAAEIRDVLSAQRFARSSTGLRLLSPS